MSSISPDARISPQARIHPTADIEQGVSVGSGSAVWHRAQVLAGAVIGRDNIIGRDVFIDKGVTLGDRVKVQNAALIYHGVTIGNGVFIGPGAILTNDRRPRALNRSGELARGADWTVTPIRVHDGASIGAGAIVVAGCDIGAWSMVGAGAVVTHDVPAHALVVGNPARAIGWICICGANLHEEDGESYRCPECDRQFQRDSSTGSIAERVDPAAREVRA